MTISKLMKMAESSQNGQKTLWEKEKLLVASNFSFFHSVFKRLVLQTRKNQGLFRKGLRYQLETLNIYSRSKGQLVLQVQVTLKVFLRIISPFRLRVFTHFQAVNSGALAPTCDALVYCGAHCHLLYNILMSPWQLGALCYLIKGAFVCTNLFEVCCKEL